MIINSNDTLQILIDQKEEMFKRLSDEVQRVSDLRDELSNLKNKPKRWWQL